MKKLLKNKKILAIIGGSAAVVLAAVLLVYNMVVLPNQRYETAIRLFAEGNYAEAYEAIQKVPEKKNDTETLLPYYEAYADFSAGDYASAAQKFEAAGEYEDSVPMAGYCRAVELMEQKKYSEAYGEFAALGEFRDSQDMLKECPYRVAEDLMTSGDFEGALSRFTILTGYKDSDAKGQECSYQLALATLERKEYGDAYNAFLTLGDYGNSKEMLSECRYRMAGDLMAGGDLAGALERYDALAGYKDSADQAKECRYQQAAALVAQQTVDAMTQAQELYGQLGDYKDAAAQVTTLAAAIEEASRVPYTPSSEAFFDVDCTNPNSMRLKVYQIALYGNGGSVKIISAPNIGSYYRLRPGELFKYGNSAEGIQSATIGTASISQLSENDVFLDYRVKRPWDNGTSRKIYAKTGVLAASAVRWGNTAIYLQGKYDNYSAHNSFIEKATAGKTVSRTKFSGMIGGAIQFGEYDYIDLSSMYFSEADSVYSGKNGHKYYEPNLLTTDGVKIAIHNSCSGGEVTETYNGIEIFTFKNTEAYIHIKPDIYIRCYTDDDNVVKARQTLRELIDNYHHV